MKRILLIIGLVTSVRLVFASNIDDGPLVTDDFDSQISKKLWRLDKVAPGAALIQHEIVRRGNGALVITIHANDPSPQISADPTERDELQESDRFNAREGETDEYRFSAYVPKDFPIVKTRLVIAQWKQHSRGKNVKVDNPIVALRYTNGELSVTVQNGSGKRTIARLNEDIRGRWIDIVAQIRHSVVDGLVRIIVDEKLFAEYLGPTAYGEDIGYPVDRRFYFKMGLYRDDMVKPMTIYFDEYSKIRVGGGSGTNQPNQALEPTTPAVTPRAPSRTSRVGKVLAHL